MVYKEKDCVERSISPDGVAFYTVFFFFRKRTLSYYPK